jgi:uncharacterized membrane-anchored protein
MKKILLFSILAIVAITNVYAGDEKDSLAKVMAKETKFMDSVEKVLKYETGKITLGSGNAVLNVPEGFKFLNAEQSSFLLNKVWGNPPQTGVLGMLFPKNGGAYEEHSYAFIVSYEEMGFVKDNDADKINYDDMLKQLQTDEVEENNDRMAQGYGGIHMVGWASKPYYDKTNKVLHWAKNLKFADADENTLNYEVRILGRKGVLSMNAIASMSDLDSVKNDINKVLAIPSFTEGNTYKDFDSKTDNIAAWTIGGLVAGKLLLKVGLFATIGKVLLASWKFILIGIAAVWGGAKKFFGKNKDNSN